MLAFDVVIKQVHPTEEENASVNLTEYGIYIVHFRKLKNEKVAQVATFANMTLGEESYNWSLVRKHVASKLRRIIGGHCSYAAITNKPFDFRLYVKKADINQSIEAVRAEMATNGLVLIQGR